MGRVGCCINIDIILFSEVGWCYLTVVVVGGVTGRPSEQEQDLVIFPTPPGKTFATGWGLRGHGFQMDVSCAPASSEPLRSHGQEEGECPAGCFCHKRTLCLSYR